jgi:hypothetical protein
MTDASVGSSVGSRSIVIRLALRFRHLVLSAGGRVPELQRGAGSVPVCLRAAPRQCECRVGAIGILSRLLPRLRAAFPRARLRVRLDGGFAAAEMFAFLEREGLEYVVTMGKNKVLERRAARLMGTARRARIGTDRSSV